MNIISDIDKYIENKKEALQAVIKAWIKMKTIILLLIMLLFNGSIYSQMAQKVASVFPTHPELSNIRDFTMSSSGQECYTTLQSPLGEISVIVGLKKDGKHWTKPRIPVFSGNYKDLEPCLSPDNLRLYFASNRPKENTDRESKDFDIWYVERKSIDAEWGQPVNLGHPVNTERDEFYPSVALNNNLYFTSNRMGSKGEDDIFYSKWNGHEYESPVSLSDSINTPGYEFNAFIAHDESFIIFSGYNRKDGYGSGDLYISYKNKDGEWGKAANLGKEINSKYLDYCPFVDISSSTLYFTSKRSAFKEINNFQTLDEVIEEINKDENGMSSVYKISIEDISNSDKNIEDARIAKFAKLFNDLENYLSKENGKFWNHQLYGPILFVNRIDRTIIANQEDSKGVLRKKGEIYTGILPNEINIANTALDWNGKRWTMVMLPLEKKYNDRLTLLIHELFHRIQPEIGFANLHQNSCNHLDKIEGRIYLKLELEALKKALSSNKYDQKEHIKNALLFRLYRYQQFRNAKENENMLEINEGLAEYTAIMLSGRDNNEMQLHFVNSISRFYDNNTFVRSFAYQTIPLYGYLLSQHIVNWHKEISKETNLTDFFITSFTIDTTTNKPIEQIAAQNNYDYQNILANEKARENQRLVIIENYKTKFLREPTLKLVFENMNISFDPRNITPLENIGTIYPNLRITDNWGILTVENGALLSKDWSHVIVSVPIDISEVLVKGEGWTLELNNGWYVEQINDTFELKKK